MRVAVGLASTTLTAQTFSPASARRTPRSKVVKELAPPRPCCRRQLCGVLACRDRCSRSETPAKQYGNPSSCASFLRASIHRYCPRTIVRLLGLLDFLRPDLLLCLAFFFVVATAFRPLFPRNLAWILVAAASSSFVLRMSLTRLLS